MTLRYAEVNSGIKSSNQHTKKYKTWQAENKISNLIYTWIERKKSKLQWSKDLNRIESWKKKFLTLARVPRISCLLNGFTKINLSLTDSFLHIYSRMLNITTIDLLFASSIVSAIQIRIMKMNLLSFSNHTPCIFAYILQMYAHISLKIKYIFITNIFTAYVLESFF